MGDTGRAEEVTIAQAAYLVRRNERAVRWHVAQGHLTPRTGADGHMRLDVEALAGVRGWRVDLARLDELRMADGRTAEAMDVRLRSLERRVRDLEARLTAQSVASAPMPAPHDRYAALPLRDALPYPKPPDLPLSASQGHSDAFSHKTGAARWLEGHGVNAHTVKTWRGWPPDDLTPTSVLTFALDLRRSAKASGDWRVSWSLRRCGDVACVCHELLDA